MKNLVKFVWLQVLLAGVFGCAAESTEKAAANARVEAADARLDAANANARVNTATATATQAVAVNGKITIPSGTILKVLLIDGLSTDTNSTGDRFLASLGEPVVADGRTLLSKGTKVRGRVISVEESGRVKGRASIRLALTDIMQDNKVIPITTNTFSATAKASKTRDTEIIAGGAGVGAAIGAIAGGAKGAAIGAIAGGGAGTGAVLATKGKAIHYPPETRLTFTLANSIRL
jgi:hypothetical protein